MTNERLSLITQSRLPDHSETPKHNSALRLFNPKDVTDRQRIKAIFTNQSMESQDLTTTEQENIQRLINRGAILFAVSGSQPENPNEIGKMQGYILFDEINPELHQEIRLNNPEFNFNQNTLIIEISYYKFLSASRGQMFGAVHQALVSVSEMYEKTRETTSERPAGMAVVALVDTTNSVSKRILSSNGFIEGTPIKYIPLEPEKLIYDLFVLDWNQIYPWKNATSDPLANSPCYIYCSK